MSFIEQFAQKGKFQLLEFLKDGTTYLIFYRAQDAKRAYDHFGKTGKISLKEGCVLWQGQGSIPPLLEDALQKVGWSRKFSS